MIQFMVKLNQCRAKKIPSSYPALIDYESEFKIMINGEIFFDDPNFPLLEFLRYATEWIKHTDMPFEYSSIETEDNPLIVFSSKNGTWAISSPWQKFKCYTSFTKEEFIDAINVLLAKVVSSK